MTRLAALGLLIGLTTGCTGAELMIVQYGVLAATGAPDPTTAPWWSRSPAGPSARPSAPVPPSAPICTDGYRLITSGAGWRCESISAGVAP